MEFNSTDEISSSEAQKIIREIIEFILQHGIIVKKEFKDKTQTWSYKISGQDLEGDDGAVIVTIIKRMSAVIITVLG